MIEKIAIYPGTFDPITNGHIDLIERACSIFDKIIIIIATNSKKTNLFSETKRLEMARISLQHIANCEVIIHNGLTVEIAKQYGAVAMIRGVRAVSDFDYEFQIALANRKLEPAIHTLFMMPHERYSYLNSSIVRELASFGKDVSSFVPPIVSEQLSDIFKL